MEDRLDLNIGHATAYAYAVSKGYTGTEEQFALELAQFAQNAQKVAEDRAAVEALVDEFLNTTVPSAVQSVTDEGTKQIELVGDVGTTQIGLVQDEGTTQVGNVNNAGTDQVSAVNQAGQTQVEYVTNEGTTQVDRVQDKGDEVIASIPSDYSDLADDVSGLTRQLNDETTGLNTKAPVILETASGAIASFSDGADNMPIKKLVAQIEPVQDLHGFDNPWPAGGGANVFDAKTWATLGSNPNFYSVDNDETITVDREDGSGLTGRFIDLEAGEQYSFLAESFSSVGVFDTTNIRFVQASTGTFTAPSDGKIAIKFYASSYPTSGKFILVKGSTIPAEWSPYENICPISGWTGAEIEQRGKNLLAKPFTFRPVPSVFADCFFIKAGTYTFAFDSIGTATSWRFGISIFDANGVVLSGARHKPNPDCYFLSSINMFYWQVDVTIKTFTLTIVEDCFIRIWFGNGNTDSSMIASGARLELGSTATDYEPYTGNQISVNWEDEAGTIYSGTLDVTSGKLLVDKGIVTFDGSQPASELGLTPVPEFVQVSWLPFMQIGTSNAVFICDKYKYQNSAGLYKIWPSDVPRMFLGVPPELTTHEAVSSYFRNNPITVVYPIATPVEYQLTPQEVETLLGTNNIWADTGDITVEYPADTKLYINGKLAEIQATILENIGG